MPTILKLITYQSAYKSLHSTETALLRVHDDILGAINNNRSVALLLLDILAAFDQIDHGILLHLPEFCFGIKGSAPSHTREKPLAPRVHQTTHCLQNLELVTTHKALNGLASGYITNLLDRCPYAIPTIL